MKKENKRDRKSQPQSHPHRKNAFPPKKRRRARRMPDPLREKWESLTLADNFIFYWVMRHHPRACKRIIELLLGVRIGRMRMSGEEVIIADRGSKSVRLDVFVKDAKQLFDVEIQVANTGELPERARYYQGLMDIDSLKPGQPYTRMRNSHVIFICMTDIFGRGLPAYTFENVCAEDGAVKLGDRAWKHFFIAPICAKMAEDEDVRGFFEFLVSNRTKSAFTSRLGKYVNAAKHDVQWRIQYMTWERQRYYDYHEGHDNGARETAIANAKNALAMGLTAEQAAQITSLPLDEVLALKAELSRETAVTA